RLSPFTTFQNARQALEFAGGRCVVFFAEGFGEGLLVEEEALGDEEGILLLARVEVFLDEFLEGFFLEGFEFVLPYVVLDREPVRAFKAGERELEVEVVEVVAEEFADRGAGVALQQVVADVVENLD